MEGEAPNYNDPAYAATIASKATPSPEFYERMQSVASELGLSLEVVEDVWQRLEASALHRRDSRPSATEARLRSAIESSVDGFFLLDAVRDEEGRIVDFRYSDVNGRALEYVKRTREDLLSHSLLSVYPDHRLAPFVIHYARVVETGEQFEGEVESAKNPGRTFSLRANRVGDSVTVTMADVTIYRAQQREVEAQNGRLRQLSKELELAAAQAAAEQEFVDTILDSLDSLVCVMARDGRIVRFNAACEALSGWRSEEVVGYPFWQVLLSPEERERVHACFGSATVIELPPTCELEWITRDGRRRLISFRNTNIRDDGGEIRFVIGTGADITDARATEAETRRIREQLELAQEIAGIGSWEANLQTGEIRWSAHMFRLFGFEPAEHPPTRDEWFARIAPEDLPFVEEAIERCHSTMADVEFKHRVELPNGEERTVATQCHPIPSEGRVIGTTMDVTAQSRWERDLEAAMLKTVEETILLELQRQELTAQNESLAQLAKTDGLTGIANHRTFQEELAESLVVGRRAGNPVSVVLLDVDHFKRFNDEFGHPAGDAILKQVAHLLVDVSRYGDLVARYGGEEFAVILPNADARTARAVAERLRAAVEGYLWTYRQVTVSCGVATTGPSHPGREALIDAADRALYTSKAAGRNRTTHADDLVPQSGVAIVATCDPSSLSSRVYRPCP